MNYLIYSLAGLVFLFYLLQCLWSPLRTIQGPFLARFTDGWYLWKVSKGHFDSENCALHRKYGAVVRYGPKRYSFNDLGASKIIYGHGSHFKKSSWYQAWEIPVRGKWNIFADQDVSHHALQRRRYQQTYSMSALVSYEPYVDECADLLTQRLTELARTGLAIDMGHWFQCYAFDVIGLITYGRRFGFLDQGDDIGNVIAALEVSLKYSSIIGIYPGLHWYSYRLLNWLAGSRGAGIQYVNNFTQERINDYRANPKATSTDTENGGAEPFLSKFFKKHEEDPDAFTAYHIFHGCSANVGAGSDTTAISLSAILYYLLKQPECMQKLREEIDSRRDTASKNIDFKMASDMPYLQSVIKEAMRLHPATGLPLERVVPEGGATIAGRFFPEGTIVGINTWVEHRSDSIFGEDTNLFRPERWLINDAEKLALMNRHWIPFGLGSRSCIGKNISLLEMTKLIPRLICDFDFKVHGVADKMWDTNNFWFVKPKGFNVDVTLRNR